ncbi:MAG: hypothetical protein RMY16_10950 [Nostoc sp. DedQUE12b]|nr:hypothetical protein [Nostoc sp. DedQUE12b]MDZ8086064.1 hypothetical protein [Nostoc sp. DedQUE12b]
MSAKNQSIFGDFLRNHGIYICNPTRAGDRTLTQKGALHNVSAP